MTTGLEMINAILEAQRCGCLSFARRCPRCIALEALKRLAERYSWHPISEIHEDYGDCVLVNIKDCGCMTIGSNLNLGFDESEWTHFTRFAPIGQHEYERMKAEAANPQMEAAQ